MGELWERENQIWHKSWVILESRYTGAMTGCGNETGRRANFFKKTVMRLILL